MLCFAYLLYHDADKKISKIFMGSDPILKPVLVL